MQNVHLALLIHGLYGSRDNLLQLEAELLHAQANASAGFPELDVLLAQGISGQLSYDGIDIQARQVAKELDARIEQLHEQGKNVTAITITGYSLGGLVARFLVGLLDSRDPEFFERHRPAMFTTIATPHLGIPRYSAFHLRRGVAKVSLRLNAVRPFADSRMSRVQHYVGPSLFSSSGRQLFCTDSYGTDGRCLLEVMADPHHRFIPALQKFESISIFANGCNDLTVPFPTAAFSEVDPFVDFEHSGLVLELDDDQVVGSWSLPASYSGGAVPGTGTGSEEPLLLETIPTSTTSSPGRKIVNAATFNRKRQAWPPPVQVALNLRFPLNYIVLSCLPFLIPLFICYALATTSYHSFRSYRRMASLLSAEEKASLLLHDALDAIGDVTGKRPDAAHPIDDYSEDLTGLKSIGHSGTATPVIANKVPLQLSRQQILMSRNLNNALPKAKKIISWFPAAYNSHAMIVLRDTKRFPAQEEARGLVRKWARMTVEAGADSVAMAP